MRLLICGNCSWPEEYPIRWTIDEHKRVAKEKQEPLVVVSGMAPGADTIAWEQAAKADVYCDPYPWSEYGRRKNAVIVYPKKPDKMRNQWMLDSGVDVCFAFAYDLPKASFGTRDMVNRCFKAGVPEIYWFNGEVTYYIDKFIHDKINPEQDLEVVE